MLTPTEEHRVKAGFKALLERLRKPKDEETARQRAESMAAAIARNDVDIEREWHGYGLQLMRDSNGRPISFDLARNLGFVQIVGEAAE